MKKTMVLCALLIGFGAYAQHRAPRHGNRAEMQKELTTGQRATLQSKRMALALGLDRQQQEQVAAVLSKHLEQAGQERTRKQEQAGTGPDMDPQDRYLHINERLDRQIAFQEELRGILTGQQFEMWKTRREARHSRRAEYFRKPGRGNHARGRE